jgi:hypothetical protein
MLVAPLCVAMFTGCLDDAVAPHVPAPPADATPLFWGLRNDHRAVTLSTAAPYDTLRIRAVPHDGAGRALSLEGAKVTYTSAQPSRAVVSDSGIIRAIAPGTNIYVISQLVVNNVRHVDTTVVNVTTHATPPAVALFSSAPVAPDSARWVMHHDELSLLPGFSKRLPLRIEDAAGRPITGVAVRYSSSDPVLAPIVPFTGEIKSKRLGRATFTAEATIYGTTWKDSVEFVFDWPPYSAVSIYKHRQSSPDVPPSLYYDPTYVRIGKGGTVAFRSYAQMAVQVEFDDPTHVEERTTLRCAYAAVDPGGSGNIALFGDATISLNHCRSRRFPVPGVYKFRVTPGGPTGTIVVEESAL